MSLQSATSLSLQSSCELGYTVIFNIAKLLASSKACVKHSFEVVRNVVTIAIAVLKITVTSKRITDHASFPSQMIVVVVVVVVVIEKTSISRQCIGKLRIVSVYIQNDVLQQIYPFVSHTNANAIAAGEHQADFFTIHRKVLAKVDNMFTIKCSDVDAITQMLTKLNPPSSGCFTLKRPETSSTVNIL